MVAVGVVKRDVNSVVMDVTGVVMVAVGVVMVAVGVVMVAVSVVKMLSTPPLPALSSTCLQKSLRPPALATAPSTFSNALT